MRVGGSTIYTMGLQRGDLVTVDEEIQGFEHALFVMDEIGSLSIDAARYVESGFDWQALDLRPVVSRDPPPIALAGRPE